jgi:hypothetical protein
MTQDQIMEQHKISFKKRGQDQMSNGGGVETASRI